MFDSVKNFFSNCAATFQKLRNLTSAKGPEGSAGVQLQNLNIHSVPQSEKKGLFSSSTRQWIITPMNNRAIDGNPQQSPVVLNNISPFEASKLLYHSELLETTCERMQSIDPSNLKEDDVAKMQALRETVDNPETPQSLKEAAKQKVVDVSKTINPKAIECYYAIPTDISDKICSDKTGAYAVKSAAPMVGFEVKLQKNETRSKALQESRREIVELFDQSEGKIDQNLTEKLQAYGEKMIEPLAMDKNSYLPYIQEYLPTEIKTFGQKAAQVLQEELKNYKGDIASLDNCLQDYEKKMRAFAYDLVKNGQSASTVNQEGNYLYCDMPVDIEAVNRHDSTNDFNTVAVLNTHLQEPLTDKTLEGLKKELEQLRKQLTNCQTNEQLQTIEGRYKDVNKEIEKRSAFREQCLTNLAVMQAFGKSKEDDESFSTRALATTQQLSNINLMFKEMDKEQGKYSAALEKAKEELLKTNKTAPQPQDPAAPSITAVQ